MDLMCYLATEPKKDGSKEEFPCLKHWNEDLGGVDKADRLCSRYGIGRKSKKWCHIVQRLCSLQEASRAMHFCARFHRFVVQELLTLTRLPRARRPALTTPPTKIHLTRSTEYSLERGVGSKLWCTLGCVCKRKREM